MLEGGERQATRFGTRLALDQPRRQGRDTPGNPFAAEVGKRRARLMKAIRDKDIDQAVKVMREVMATGKDSDRLTAAKLLLDRALGPIVEADLVERLERLEDVLSSQRERKGK